MAAGRGVPDFWKIKKSVSDCAYIERNLKSCRPSLPADAADASSPGSPEKESRVVVCAPQPGLGRILPSGFGISDRMLRDYYLQLATSQNVGKFTVKC